MTDKRLLDAAHSSWPVFGHQWAVSLLQSAIVPRPDASRQAVGGPNHAYLLTGPRHVGKTTLARAFAQALLCEGHQAVACNHCRACRLMLHASHPDFRLVQPLDKAGEADRVDGILRVEQANDLVHEAAMRPLEGRYKVFLIQDIHTANDSFANKLLKTLEEPPAHVILCLTAEDRTQLLPTIVSRCQVLALRPLTPTAVQQALVTQWQTPTDQAMLLSRLANGRLGWAVQELTDVAFLDSRQESLSILRQLVSADRVDRLAFAAALAAERNSARIFGILSLWTSWWRDVMLVQAGYDDACSNIDHLDELTAQAQLISASAVRRYLETIQQIEGYLHHTVNIRMALDVLLLKLPGPATRESRQKS